MILFLLLYGSIGEPCIREFRRRFTGQKLKYCAYGGEYYGLALAVAVIFHLVSRIYLAYLYSKKLKTLNNSVGTKNIQNLHTTIYIVSFIFFFSFLLKLIFKRL